MKELAKINALAEQIKKLHEQTKIECNKLLHDEIAKLLRETPRIKRIQWAQYTPYFNDGDACVFSANEPDIICFREGELVDVEAEDDYLNEQDDEKWFEDDYLNEQDDEKWFGEYELKELVKNGESWAVNAQKICDIVSAIPEDIKGMLFGDHVLVVIDKNGIKTEEYSHD